MNAKPRRQTQQGMANVVAVADISQLESAQSAEALFEREKIRQGLAGMELVGKRVDHRNAGVCGHFLEHLLRINARHDAVNPAVEVARHIRYRFPLDRKSTRLNSSHGYISYAVFCLK